MTDRKSQKKNKF